MYAYVIDTGISTTHVEFESGTRAVLGYNAYPDSEFLDVVGHGTHVSCTIASGSYGVAKKATVVAVKVFDAGSVSFPPPNIPSSLFWRWLRLIFVKKKSTTSIVLDGYTWAVRNITSSVPGRADTSVINMSLGGPYSEAVNSAVGTAFRTHGVVTVVAAGNNGNDAKNASPASAPEAVTVGAVDVANKRPDWSNYGPLVDIFAPGVEVLSCWRGETGTESLVLDGTSMATPHVSGLVLYLKSLGGGGTVGSGKAAVAVVERLKGIATGGVVTAPGKGSPNLLAYNGNGA